MKPSYNIIQYYGLEIKRCDTKQVTTYIYKAWIGMLERFAPSMIELFDFESFELNFCALKIKYHFMNDEVSSWHFRKKIIPLNFHPLKNC